MKLDEILRERIGEYWDLAYREGVDGREQDTLDGEAGATWHTICMLIQAITSESEKWKSLCEAQELILKNQQRMRARELKLQKLEKLGDGE